MTESARVRSTVVDFGSKPCLIMKILEFKYGSLSIHFEPVQIQWTWFGKCKIDNSSPKLDPKFIIFHEMCMKTFFH